MGIRYFYIISYNNLYPSHTLLTEQVIVLQTYMYYHLTVSRNSVTKLRYRSDVWSAHKLTSPLLMLNEKLYPGT